jgi:hypothetical protein
MLDPFPFHTAALEPLAAYTGLSTLPLHIHEVLLSALGYTFIQVYVSPTLSTFLFPSTYPKLSRRSRLNWDVHVVSFVQSVWVCVLALWVMREDRERAAMNWEQRVLGYTGALGLVQAFACGYFVWDLWVSARYLSMFGLGMLAHAVSALTVYAFGFVSGALFHPFVSFLVSVWTGVGDVGVRREEDSIRSLCVLGCFMLTRSITVETLHQLLRSNFHPL